MQILGRWVECQEIGYRERVVPAYSSMVCAFVTYAYFGYSYRPRIRGGSLYGLHQDFSLCRESRTMEAAAGEQ